MKLPFLGLLLLAMISCKDDDTTDPIPVEINSFITVPTEGDINEVTGNLQVAISSDGFSFIPGSPVEHDIAALGVGLELDPTRLYIFGKPKAGTLLMQQDQRMGIDLPLKMLVYEDEKGQINIGYYNASTLAKRYNITNDTLLSTIDANLAKFSGLDTSGPIIIKQENTPRMKEKESTQDLETTYAQLTTAITDRGFKIISEVNHDAAANSVELELRPTRLIIFGKPEGGTLLMQSDQRVGIDLPLKVLVYEDADNKIKVAYYGSDFLADRYNLEDKANVLGNIGGALEMITDDAIKTN